MAPPASAQCVQHPARIDRPHAGQQLQHAERCKRIARIVRPAQHADHVLDMRGFQEFQAAVFDERDLAAHQLHFEQVAVAVAAEQHRLALEGRAGFAPLQHLLRHVLGL